MVYVDKNGDLVSRGEKLKSSLAINALPDACILFNEDGKGVHYTGPTIHYPHGVLGDASELSGIAIFSIGEDLLLLS